MEGHSGLIDKILADMQASFNVSRPTPTEASTPPSEIPLCRNTIMDRHRMQNEVMVDCIRKNPALWDHTDPQFDNQHYRQLLWDNIAIVMKWSVKKVKSRWSALKKNYRRSYAKKMATGRQPKMLCYDKLGFLEEETKRAIEAEQAVLLRAKALQESRTKELGEAVGSISLLDDDSDIEAIIDDEDDCCIVDVVMKTPTDQNQPASTATSSPTPATQPPANGPEEMDGIVSPHCLSTVRLRNISELMTSSSTPRVESATSTSTETPSSQKNIPKEKGVRFSEVIRNYQRSMKRSLDVVFIEEKARGPKRSKFHSVATQSDPDEASRKENHMSPTPQLTSEVSLVSVQKTVGDAGVKIDSKERQKRISEVQNPEELPTTPKPDKLSPTVRGLPETSIIPVKRRNSDESAATGEPSVSVEPIKTATARKSTSRASAGLTLSKDEWARDVQVTAIKPPLDEKEDVKEPKIKKDVKDKVRHDSANYGFLLSLLGDVETMTNAQFRVLKKHSTALVSMILDKKT